MQDVLSLVSQDRLIELCKTLISIPSVTGQEQKLSDWYFDYFQALGMTGVERLEVEEAGDSVVAWLEPETPHPEAPDFLLNPHIDTFDVADGWNTDPFTPVLDGNRLYGLGSHDMKGGVACALVALECLIASKTKLKGRLVVALTSDEENWSRGAHELIKSGLIDSCKYCLNPEPTPHNGLRVGARGRHVFRIHFTGQTIHAAFGSGINAVTDASRVAVALAEENAIDLGFNKDFGMTGTLEVIGLSGGDTIILIPEHADLYIDRHILPGETVEHAAQQITDLVTSLNLESSFKLTCDERPTPAPPPFVIPSDDIFVQTVQRILGEEQNAEIDLCLARSVADMNHIVVHGSVPTLVLGPDGGNTCEANEYVLVDSMPAITNTYIRTILELIGM